jgi:hypothetical protein
VDDHERVRWARTLTTAGWLFVVAYLGHLTTQVRRAAAITRGSFEDGVWGQRIETISFASVPQNLIILVPAAAAGVVATLVVRGIADRSDIWLAQLVRVVAGLCYVVIVIATVGIIAVFFRNPDGVGDVTAVLGRGGGIVMSIAMIRVCLDAERSA